MKTLVVFTVLSFAISAHAAQYKCSEKASDAVAKNRLQYSVIVTTLAEIKDPKVVGESDRAEKVRVSVLSRSPKAGGGFKLDRPSFEAIAKSEDVVFHIRSAAHGFSFNLYMDELDQTSMKLAGVRGDIRLNCGSN